MASSGGRARRRRSTSSLTPHTSNASPYAALTLLLASLVTTTDARSTAPSSLPQVDFSRMGSVGLGGSFAGLDFYDPSSSSSASASNSAESLTSRTEGDSLVRRHAGGSGTFLGSTDAGGSIQATCWSSWSSNSSSQQGTVFVGGNFTSVDGTKATNLAGYDVGGEKWLDVGGVGGTVKSLWCDDANQRVWIGGDFDGGVKLYSTSRGSLVDAPFGGLNGSVETIVQSSISSSVLFGGNFITSFVSNGTATNSTGNSSDTSISSAPVGTVSTNTSAYLTPISLSNATISAGPSTIDPALIADYSEPSVLSCPSEGQGWVVQDGIEAKIDLLIGGNGGVDVTGVRLGNLLLDGRGTTTFCLVTIPDNTLQYLTYTDPVNGTTQTCYSRCPLSTDPKITAQDFLFPSPVSVTGFQVYLSGWQGPSAALSRLQALSTGSFASAVQSQNAAVCAANSTGSGEQQTAVTTTGTWTDRQVFTGIPGTVLDVLTAQVSVSSSDRPSVIYYPFVASSGYYDVYVLVPGCTQMQDCGTRTTVDVEVFPSSGSLGYTDTISQQVIDDTRVLVYSGFMQASQPGTFQSTVHLALASTPSAATDGDSWEVVAGQIQFEFKAPAGNVTDSVANGTISSSVNGMNTSTRLGFGVFEWPVSAGSINAQQVLPNSTQTNIDKLAFALGDSLGRSALASSPMDTPSWSVNAIATLGDMAYIGGNFTRPSNWSNVLSVDVRTGSVAALPNVGLNDVVRAAAAVGQSVFFGGDFTDTVSASSSSLSRIARYDSSSKAWSPLGGGVDGTVTQILPVSGNSSLLISGNFSNVFNADGSASASGGWAIWNITSDPSGGSWELNSAGVVFGNISETTIGDAAGTTAFLAGRISGLSSNGAQGIAMLSGSGSHVVIDTLPVALSSSGAAKSAPGGTPSRRSPQPVMKRTTLRSMSRSWVSMLSGVVHSKRQNSNAANIAPAIPLATSVAPAILAGAFWTNSSASGDPTMTILGGNFTKASPAVEGLGFYDQKAKTISGVNGPALSGVVRALAVHDNTVYVGGNLSVGSSRGLAAYDLQSNTWSTSSIPALTASTGSNVSVNALSIRDGTTSLIVAGAFATAGSLGCAAVCSWDIADTRWSSLGAGLQSGEVRAIDFAGSSSDTLIVAGSFVMADNTLAYVAQYSFPNSTWVALGRVGNGDGQIPGPATAMTVDNSDISNIFVSGLSSSDATPYFLRWDGKAWNQQNNTLSTGSVVQQLVFVPLSSEHSTQGSIEKDRMLMVSGDLDLGSAGTFSSALFDGQQWHPYLTSLSASGAAGAVNSLFYSHKNFSFSARRFLAVGFVVLIAIAISTGLIFLLVLIGVLIALWRRPSHQQRAAAAAAKDASRSVGDESDTDSTHQRRLGAIQQAIFGPVMMATASAGATAATPGETSEKRHSDASSFEDYAAAAVTGSREGDSDDSGAPSHLGRPSQAKYDFVGEQEGELTVRMHDKLWVLEEHEDEQWSYVRDADGREGVVPASYIW